MGADPRHRSSTAELYLDNLSAETPKGKRARAQAGLWNGDPPYGYRRVPTGERRKGKVVYKLEIDEREAEAVRLAFRSYATGAYTDQQIADLLNGRGYRTRGHWGSRPWTKDSVRPMLTNHTYLGLVKYRVAPRKKEYSLYPGKHQAILDEETFEKCQEVRAKMARQRRTENQYRKVYPLAGLALCDECGFPLRAQTSTSIGVRYYLDGARFRGRECSQKMTRADVVEGTLGSGSIETGQVAASGKGGRVSRRCGEDLASCHRY